MKKEKFFVGVMGFKAVEVSQSEADQISERLIVELNKSEAFRMVSAQGAEIQKLFEEKERQEVLGSDELQCAIKVGNRLKEMFGAQLLTLGSFSRIRDEYEIIIKVLEINTREMIYSDRVNFFYAEKLDQAVKILAGNFIKKYGRK